jgi:hypothetical protein
MKKRLTAKQQVEKIENDRFDLYMVLFLNSLNIVIEY